MLVAHNFSVDWDEYVNKLFKPLDCIDMEVMDEDIVDVLLTKSWTLWEPDGTCTANNALLLCSSVNWSTNISLTDPQYGHVISATVVWVVLDQAHLSIPDDITTLLDMAKNRQDGVALCYIPIYKPFFPYPEDGPHVLVIPYDNKILASLGFGMPADYAAYEMTSYTTGTSVAMGLTAWLQFGPKCPLSTEEKQTVHFTTVENHGTMWSNQTYVKQMAQGEANIFHKVYLGDGIIAEPPSWQLNPEQHWQVIQAIAQNPTIVSCFKAAVSQWSGVEDPVHFADSHSCTSHYVIAGYHSFCLHWEHPICWPTTWLPCSSWGTNQMSSGSQRTNHSWWQNFDQGFLGVVHRLPSHGWVSFSTDEIHEGVPACRCWWAEDTSDTGSFGLESWLKLSTMAPGYCAFHFPLQ